MTSNHVEHLDPALIRPGRIDYRLKLDLATKEQARTIFLRLQAADYDVPEKQVDLLELARSFADKVPDKLVSPADLQDFLLRHRDEPEKAVGEVDAWIQEKLAAQEDDEDKFVDAVEPKIDQSYGWGDLASAAGAKAVRKWW